MHGILQDGQSNVAAAAQVKKAVIRKIKPTEGPKPEPLQVMNDFDGITVVCVCVEWGCILKLAVKCLKCG